MIVGELARQQGRVITGCSLQAVVAIIMGGEHAHVDKLAVALRKILSLAFILDISYALRRTAIRVVVPKILALQPQQARQVVLLPLLGEQPASHLVGYALSTSSIHGFIF